MKPVKKDKVEKLVKAKDDKKEVTKKTRSVAEVRAAMYGKGK